MALLILDDGKITGSGSTVPPSVITTSSKSLDVEYQNGSRWRMVIFGIFASVAAAGDHAIVYGAQKASPGVTITGASMPFGLVDTSITGTIVSYITCVFWVAPYYYYKIISANAGTGLVMLSAVNGVTEADV